MYIYILRLVDNKYYVGRTNYLENRIRQHVSGNGSTWTRVYKPIGFVEKYTTNDPFDEDRFVLRYMKAFGIENVRGGSFPEFELSKESVSIIGKMIRNASDMCFICGEYGHFSTSCTTRTIFNRLEDKNVQTEAEDFSKTSGNIIRKIFKKNT